MAGETTKTSSNFSTFIKKLLRLHNSDEVAESNMRQTQQENLPNHERSQEASTAASVLSSPSISSMNLSSGSGSHTGNAPATTVVLPADPASRNSHSTRVAPDTASVLTIASSSKQRRRRSLDTNASTHPLVAESIFSNAESVEAEV